MSGPVLSDLEPTLDALVPEYMAWLRTQEEWREERDAVATVFLVLERLRLWLLDLGRGETDVRARAWRAVEQLAPTSDELLLNGLMVGLLEGHWPRRDTRLWGPRTLALWEAVQAPPG